MAYGLSAAKATNWDYHIINFAILFLKVAIEEFLNGFFP
jgi:hypothetical protein